MSSGQGGFVQVRFLGCGDAFGSGGRFHTCILVAASSSRFLVDCGASSMIAIRRFGVDPNTIGTILLSHLHGDHFAGIPFVILDAQFVSKRTQPLRIAGPPGTRTRVAEAMEVLFPGSSGARRRFPIEMVELDPGRPWALAEATVTPYLVHHPSGNPPFALRIECGGKVITYSGDTEWTDGLIPACRGADLLIAESSSFNKDIKYHMSFTTLMAHLGDLDVKRLVLTHMGPDMLSRVATLSCDYAEDGKTFEV